jgi:hypothetical protein
MTFRKESLRPKESKTPKNSVLKAKHFYSQFTRSNTHESPIDSHVASPKDPSVAVSNPAESVDPPTLEPEPKEPLESEDQTGRSHIMPKTPSKKRGQRLSPRKVHPKPSSFPPPSAPVLLSGIVFDDIPVPLVVPKTPSKAVAWLELGTPPPRRGSRTSPYKPSKKVHPH